MGNHTTNGLVEDAGRGAEVEGSAKGVEPVTLPEVRVVLNCIELSKVRCEILANNHFPVCMHIYVWGGGHTLVPEKLARDVQILTSHDHDLLAVEKLLGHDTGQTTKEMSLAIDNDLRNPDPLAQLFPQVSTGQLEALQRWQEKCLAVPE